VQLVNILRHDIAAGVYQASGELPTEAELRAAYDVSPRSPTHPRSRRRRPEVATPVRHLTANGARFTLLHHLFRIGRLAETTDTGRRQTN
jgi:Bacterial regulatory proteins, gntR family